MKSEVIANRYAEALLLSATEHHNADALLERVEWYRSTVAASLWPFLENPRISHEKKQSLIKKIVLPSDSKENAAKDSGASLLLFHFIGLLLKRGRIGYLNDALRLYPKKYEEKRGMVKARLYLAYPMEPDVLHRLQTKIEAKLQRKVLFEIIHNPEILGGFIVSTDTQQVDASLKRRLHDMEERLKSVSVA